MSCLTLTGTWSPLVSSGDWAGWLGWAGPKRPLALSCFSRSVGVGTFQQQLYVAFPSFIHFSRLHSPLPLPLPLTHTHILSLWSLSPLPSLSPPSTLHVLSPFLAVALADTMFFIRFYFSTFSTLSYGLCVQRTNRRSNV